MLPICFTYQFHQFLAHCSFDTMADRFLPLSDDDDADFDPNAPESEGDEEVLLFCMPCTHCCLDQPFSNAFSVAAVAAIIY